MGWGTATTAPSLEGMDTQSGQEEEGMDGWMKALQLVCGRALSSTTAHYMKANVRGEQWCWRV